MVTPEVSPEDNAKFEALYQAQYKSIYAYVWRRAPFTGADVHDIVSDVFTAAWRRIGELPPSPQDRLWLFGVAQRCLLAHQRRGRRRLQLLARIQAQPNRVELVEAGVDSLHLEVRSALQSLRPRDREVLTLVYWDGMSHADAASVLDCSVNAVALRISKAKARLHSQMTATSSMAEASALVAPPLLTPKEHLP